jgi:anaerobic selenocysteine-containing dehydrogenase
MPNLHHRTCNLCEAMCGLVITHENNQIQKIEGDFNDPLSRGHICPKAFGLKDIYEDPDRLKLPLVKKNGQFESISWENAYEIISDKIIEMNMKYGPNSIAVYQGNPSIHNLGTMLTSSPFFKALKTKNMYTATSADQLPHHFASWIIYGHPLLIPIPDIDRTQLFVILGGNPLVSNGSMMSVPDIGNRIKELQNRGGKLVVVDPRKTETAQKANSYLAINPGTDAWLLGTLVNIILEKKPNGLAHLTAFTEGLKEIKKAVSVFDIEICSEKTGISSQEISALADLILQTPKAAIYGRVGVSTQQFGGLCHWFINVLNCITGNLDKEGGVMFPVPYIDFVATSQPRERYNRWQSRVSKFPEFIGEIPVSYLAEEIETEGQGQIKMLMVSCGNPVLSIPNGNRLDEALPKLDFMVSFDIYLNETSRHADIILPPATGVETAHYDLTFHNLAIRNTSKYSEPLFAKSEGAKYDWEIFQELGHVLSKKATGGVQNEGMVFSPEQILTKMSKNNIYGIDFKTIMENPHGVDLGSLKPAFPARIVHLDKKIQLSHPLFEADIERLFNQKIEIQKKYALIGKRHLRDNNSWMHNSEQLQKGKNRCVVYIHTDDASFEKLKNGDIVELSSRVGKVKLPIEITENIKKGVLAMPHGYGHTKAGIKMSIAASNAGVSLNDLTDEAQIDSLTGVAGFNDLRVSLKAV